MACRISEEREGRFEQQAGDMDMPRVREEAAGQKDIGTVNCDDVPWGNERPAERSVLQRRPGVRGEVEDVQLLRGDELTVGCGVKSVELEEPGT